MRKGLALAPLSKMQEKLIIQAAEDTPQVILDKENNKFEISGKSLPEDACEFYSPIKKWLIDYCKSPNETTIFNCKFNYFNSATARKLVEIFSVLESLKEKNAKIVWQCKKDDSVIIDKGQELDYLINIPFEFVALD